MKPCKQCYKQKECSNLQFGLLGIALFFQRENSKMEVASVDRLDIWDGKFLNSYHQARREGNSTNEQQMMLDDVVYGLLWGNERKDIDEWLKGKNEKRKLQTVDLEMM